MKKATIIVCSLLTTLLLCGLGNNKAQAQPRYKYEVNLSIGFLPQTSSYYDNYYESFDDLYNIYEGGRYDYVSGTPLFSGEFAWYPVKRLGLGIGASYSRMKATKTVNELKGDYNINSIYLLPQVKFFYITRDHFKLYSGAAAGIEGRIIQDMQSNYGRAKFTYEVIPIGMQWAGAVVFGFTELGLGPRMSGLRIGIGYRFN